MLPSKWADDCGSAPLEFVVITSLFLAPLVAISQGTNQAFLQKYSTQLFAAQLSRHLALHPGSNPQFFATLLERDLGYGGFGYDYWCEPDPQCSEQARRVTVRVDFRGQSATATSIRADHGSVLLPALGIFALAFGLVLASLNIQAARLADQVAASIADNMALSIFELEISDHTSGLPHQPSTQEARAIAEELFSAQPAGSVTLTESEFEWIDSETLETRVCLSFRQSTFLFANQAGGTACAKSRLRAGTVRP